MLLVRFDSFTRLAFALPSSCALAAGVGTTIPVLAVDFTTFLAGPPAGAELATAVRLAVLLAAVLTRVFLAAAVLVAALLAATFLAAGATTGLAAGAAAGLAVAALRAVVFAVLLRVFLTPCNSVREAWRDTLALAVRCLGVTFLGEASTVVTVEAVVKAAS